MKLKPQTIHNATKVGLLFCGAVTFIHAFLLFIANAPHGGSPNETVETIVLTLY